MYIFVEQHQFNQLQGAYLLELKVSAGNSADTLTFTPFTSKIYYIINYQAAKKCIDNGDFNSLKNFTNIYDTGDEYRGRNQPSIQIPHLTAKMRQVVWAANNFVSRSAGEIKSMKKSRDVDSRLLRITLVDDDGSHYTIWDTISDELVLPASAPANMAVIFLEDVLNENFSWETEFYKFMSYKNKTKAIEDQHLTTSLEAYYKNPVAVNDEALSLHRYIQNTMRSVN